MPIGFASCTPRTGAPLVPLMISPSTAFLWMRGSGNSSGYQKVWPVSPGLLRRLLGAPFGHFGVMPADQDVRHFPPTIFGWAGVVRIVQKKPCFVEICITVRRNGFALFEFAERLVFSGGFIPEGSWQQPRHRIQNNSCGQFAATQHIIAN